jgi:serine/threonine protein kinase
LGSVPVTQFPITAIREIKILKKLQHDNVIKLKEIVTSKGLFLHSKILFCEKGGQYEFHLIYPGIQPVQWLDEWQFNVLSSSDSQMNGSFPFVKVLETRQFQWYACGAEQLWKKSSLYLPYLVRFDIGGVDLDCKQDQRKRTK